MYMHAHTQRCDRFGSSQSDSQYICTHIQMHTYICMCMYMHARTQGRNGFGRSQGDNHICMYIYAHVYTYIYIHMHMYVDARTLAGA